MGAEAPVSVLINEDSSGSTPARTRGVGYRRVPHSNTYSKNSVRGLRYGSRTGRTEALWNTHRGNNLGRIAFSIKGAAKAASVTESVIIAAVKANVLRARRIDGDKAVILNTDIKAWLETLPDFRATR